jgi:arylsulfatase A-like enzyme
MLSSLDVLPMALAAAGGRPPADRVLDGSDPTAALAGEAPSPHQALHWVWEQGRKQQWRAMREGRFKIIRRADNEPWQLYDLAADIGETKDLAREQPDVVQALAAKFGQWHASVKKGDCK